MIFGDSPSARCKLQCQQLFLGGRDPVLGESGLPELGVLFGPRRSGLRVLVLPNNVLVIMRG